MSISFDLHQGQGFPLASISFDLHQGQGFPYILPVCYPPYIQTANKDKVTQDQDGDSPDRCLTHAEQNALRYVAGYVLRKLRERGFGTSTTRRTCCLSSWKKKYDSISPLVKYRRISCCKYVAHIVSMAALAPRPQ